MDQHVLVVRTVEDAEHAGSRRFLADAPQEVVRLLLLGRCLERGDVDTVWVHRADDMSHDAAFARGIHCLQNKQHATRVPGDSLRVQLLLQIGELFGSGREGRDAVFLAVVEAGGGARIDFREHEVVIGAQQLFDSREFVHGRQASAAARASPEILDRRRRLPSFSARAAPR